MKKKIVLAGKQELKPEDIQAQVKEIVEHLLVLKKEGSERFDMRFELDLENAEKPVRFFIVKENELK